ncbi:MULTISPECIES: MdtA/MuxA family multidrug efflux RND transporter periplasmic adaptor subunit [Photorhabdus]|uniref:Multidrug resistance protein MdtA n=2 Tax=Photorhabdus TaxID=29487 RepID=A0ABX0AUR8_9GAMM|nr:MULTISPECIES: MdtA/MuxA family multidrug efflux RND transporter periplasmic adaptor subunit [Photorhabdus]MCC8375302.1 MdtA/MuxA family multidrug efflux RND transporter periplasmic adaptor subunit [Photorhabdus bodei]MCC8465396.1 MdtA/MuxA family multidrug efflux RND transporter periplasmic adaptor subunit [Photorhabdus bodei]MCT8351498.1 MdtA/MuxA family multidrug efflux RND transporter periplasmic adaptor subunit [Photorhabdus kayaii]MDB6370893.1 MdtA/MuxA family multidrug efflux RND trans
MNQNNKHRTFLFRAALAAIAIAAAIFFWHQLKTPQQSSPSDQFSGLRHSPLPPVQVATAKEQAVPRFLAGLGTIQAANTATVTSRVEGQLIALHFQEGQQIKQGDLLAEIDPRPFQVQLAQAKGQLAKDEAILANARQDLNRYQKLANTHLISQQEMDNQRALVRQHEASLKVDQAAIDSAKLQLTYSRITAPISGKVGLKQIDVGNFISSGNSSPIVVITQTDPVDVLFSLPENDINAVLQAQKTNHDVAVSAWDRNNQQQLAEGKLLSIDNQIDAATGTIKLKARFSNQDSILFPNQFVNVRIKVDTLENAVVIPNAALQMGNEGNFVWMLGKENKVSKHLVTVKLQDTKRVVISTGLAAGDKVVTDGIDRLTDGAKVDIVTPMANKPQPQKHHKTENS